MIRIQPELAGFWTNKTKSVFLQISMNKTHTKITSQSLILVLLGVCPIWQLFKLKTKKIGHNKMYYAKRTHLLTFANQNNLVELESFAEK